MASINNIKSLIKTSNEYFVNRSENSSFLIQSHLQVLTNIENISIFHPSNTELLEFYFILEQLLKESDSSLTLKVIDLLLHVTQSKSLNCALRDELFILPSVSQKLTEENLMKNKKLKLLLLLKNLTQGFEVKNVEGWLVELIPCLLNIILDSQVIMDILEPAMACLTNICRGNLQCTAILREYPKRKLLLRMISNLSGATAAVQLLAHEVSHLLDAEQQLSQKQVMDTFDLIFASIAIASEDQKNLSELACNIFAEMCKKDYAVRESIKSYPKFGPVLKNLLEQISTGTNVQCFANFFHMISLIVLLKREDVKQFQDDVFKTAKKHLTISEIGGSAAMVLKNLVEICDNDVKSLHQDDVCEVLKKELNLNQNELSLNTLDLEHLLSILSFVNSWINSDSQFALKLSENLDHSILANLLSHILESEHPHSVLESTGSINSSGVEGVPKSSFNKKMSEEHSPSKKKKVAKSILSILIIMKKFTQYSPQFRNHYREALQNRRILNYLIYCTQSTNSELISEAYTILCDDFFVTQCSQVLVEIQLETNERRRSHFKNNNNNFNHISRPLQHDRNFNKTMTKLNEVLQDKDNISQLKDLPMTPLISLYQSKVNSMGQSDRNSRVVMEDLRNSIVQHQIENTRILEILYESEKRREALLEESKKSEKIIDQFKEISRTQRNDFAKEKTNLEREIVQFKTQLLNSQQILNKKENELKNLQKSLNEKNNEITSLKNLNKDITQEKQKSENNVKKHQNKIEELQKEFKLNETIRFNFQKEVQELEQRVQSLTQLLSEKNTELNNMREENEVLAKVKAVINDMTMGSKNMGK